MKTRPHRWWIASLGLLFILLLGTAPLQAAPPLQGPRWVPFDDAAAPAAPTLTLLAAAAEQIDLAAALPGCTAADVATTAGTFTRLAGEGYGHPAAVGRPDLPVLRQEVEIPWGAEVTVEIVSAAYRDTTLAALGLHTIYPLQPPLPKVPGAEDRPLAFDRAAYQGPAGPAAAPVRLGESYIVRGHRVQTVEVWPVAYDARTGALRLYSQVTFRLRLTGSDMGWTEQLAARYASPAFEPSLAGRILNYNQGRPPALTADVGYLIITADAYYDAILPLADLRAGRGFDVTVTPCSEIAGGCLNYQAVQTYIQTAYDTWPIPPSHVLLVGDTDTVAGWPSVSAAQITDLYYATMDGSDDWHPDIGRGRFPVRSAAQTTIMVDKYLAYAELTGQEDWLKWASFPATCDQYLVAEGTHNYVIDTHTAPNGYTGTFPNDPQPGGDKLYCITYGATSADIQAAVNQGRWMVVYSGHGGHTGWEMDYGTTQVQSLTNYGRFPFVASHACITGDFSLVEVFGETWVLQENKAGLAFWGSSDSSFWDEDDVLERATFDALFTPVDGYIDVTGMTYAGLAAVEGAYPSSARYYWETYNILGDPALKVFMEPDLPTFNLDVQPATHELCGSETVTSSVVVGSVLGYSRTVYLTAAAPAGITPTLDPLSAQAPFTAALTLAVSAPIGDYTVLVTATDQVSYTHSAVVTVRVADTVPAAPAMISPPDGAVDILRADIAFDWSDAPQALSYQLQVDDNPGFGSPEVDISGIAASAYLLEGPLDPATTYYWRVRASNGCGDGAWAAPFSFTTRALGCILLVDDDADNPDVRTYYTAALDSLGYSYDLWDTAEQSNPQEADLSGYPAVIWFTGYPWSGSFTAENEAAVAAHLDAGGDFFLSSQDYLYEFGLTPFGQGYLHILSYSSDIGQNTVSGANPYAGLGPYSLSYPFSNYADIVNPDALGVVAFTGDSGNAAVAYDGGTFRTVFLGFPFEAIPALNDRAAVLEATMAYFGGCACTPVHDAAFSWDPPAPYAGQEVLFSGDAQGTPPLHFDWAFGDGSQGSGRYPTHAYVDPGNYTVVMTATNCETGTAVVSHTITVEAWCGLGDPDFTWAPAMPAVDEVVTFTASVTGTPPITLSWDLGDGSVAAGAQITHVYTLPGTYDVVLAAENGCDAKAVTHTVEVACPAPTAAIASDSPVVLGRPLHLTATVTGAGPFSYTWDFGDGVGTSTEANPVYTYTAAGAYTVTLLVAGRCGTATVTASVTVLEECLPPTVTIASDSPVDLGTPMHFSATVSGTGPFSYSWDFGDGVGASGEANPVYTYTAAGAFTVTLGVQGACGTDTAVLAVTVLPVEKVYWYYLPLVVR